MDMPVREAERLEMNKPQPVNMWLANYYPSDAPGTAADVVGIVFKTQDEAVEWAREKLLAEGVGVCYISFNTGLAVYPLQRPEVF